MKTYLVTGGAGFIGSNFVIYMLNKYTDVKIINVDVLTYAGNLENLKSVENNPNYTFVQADICDDKAIAKLFEEYDIDYVVNEDGVVIVDEFTGRILEGRRYGDGLHQAIEAKEHIRIAKKNRTLATITFQNFFRMYEKLSGMTGTAETEAVEFNKIYNLDVVVVPTHKPVARIDENDVVYKTEKAKFEAVIEKIIKANKKGQNNRY